MLQPLLKHSCRVSHNAIEEAEWPLLQVELTRFLNPERRLAEEISVSCIAAGVSEPLHVVGVEDSAVKRGINSRMCGCGRNDSCEMWRQLLQRCPLIKTCVGASPHRDLSI